MVINFLIGLFVFVLGLCIGSFLNCVIYRLEIQKNLKGRSFCPCCKHELSWLDLFPVFSFLFLQGKCRYCKTKISWQYPVVEIFTGIIFFLVFKFNFNFDYLNLFFLLYIASVLILIFVYDLKHYLIPDKVLIPAIFITFLYQLLFNFNLFFNFLLASIVASGFFLSIFLISKGNWMGFGDVKLAVLMGFLLGLSNVLVALFLAFFFGAIIGIILMILPARLGREKKNLKSEIPFGPFLIAGTFLAMFWGQQIIDLYFNLFLF